MSLHGLHCPNISILAILVWFSWSPIKISRQQDISGKKPWEQQKILPKEEATPPKNFNETALSVLYSSAKGV